MVAHEGDVPDPEIPGAVGHGQAPRHPYNHGNLGLVLRMP